MSNYRKKRARRLGSTSKDQSTGNQTEAEERADIAARAEALDLLMERILRFIAFAVLCGAMLGQIVILWQTPADLGRHVAMGALWILAAFFGGMSVWLVVVGCTDALLSFTDTKRTRVLAGCVGGAVWLATIVAVALLLPAYLVAQAS